MNIEAFVPAFYGNFFAVCPDIRSLFPGDLIPQEGKLLASLTHIAEALDDSEPLDSILQTQGEKHRKLEVSDAHFHGFISSFTVNAPLIPQLMRLERPSRRPLAPNSTAAIHPAV